MPKEKGFFRPDEVRALKEYAEKIGDPGAFPFTRGQHATMFNEVLGGRLPVVRPFAGIGTPQATNERLKKILERGGTGLSIAFDIVTLYGYDPTHLLARHQVGWDGVSVSTIQDMDNLFRDIPIDRLSVSKTINAPAAMIYAMYRVVADGRDIPAKMLSGTYQNDPYKEYGGGQNECLYPVDKGIKLAVDLIEHCNRVTPKINGISVSGYHYREARATTAQEGGLTLSGGKDCLRRCIERGISPGDAASQISFFVDVHNNFLEEIAKMRAMRRRWAEIARDYGVTDPKAQGFRFHAQTAGRSLTRQQPKNNIVRVALQCLAAILGGARSIHPNSYDEVLCTPTEDALRVAIRTLQILFYETGIVKWVDPLGGGPLMEQLTDEMYENIRAVERSIDDFGGMGQAIEACFPQRMLHQSAIADERRIVTQEQKIVGVNIFEDGIEEKDVDFEAEIDRRRKYEPEQIRAHREFLRNRSDRAARSAIDNIKRAAEHGENMISVLIEAARSSVTLGEQCLALREIWGGYEEPPDVSSSLARKEALKITGGLMFPKHTRILLTKIGLDGHMVGLNIFRDLFRAMGAEVITVGLRCTPEMIAKAAVEEDVSIIAASALTGFAPDCFSCLKRCLEQAGRGDIPIVGGGIILRKHQEKLAKNGIKTFLPDTDSKEIIRVIRGIVEQGVAPLEISRQREERARLGRIITVLQNDPGHAAQNLLRSTADVEAAPHYVIGITGAPGVGKSTFIRGLAKRLRRNNLRVAVIAIDPTSSKSGWTILGDRLGVRDEELDGDPGFFMRDIASRGAGSSLAPALENTIMAAGLFSDIVIVETVGSGQGDIEIASLVHTLILVMAPLGNRVTAEKAGQTEYAHIVVLNTRRGFTRSKHFLAEAVMALTGELDDGWERRVFEVDAKFEVGTDAVADELFRHKEFLSNKKSP